MKKKFSSTRLILVLVAVVLLPVCFTASSGCKTTPVTGRRQLQLIPASKEVTLGATSYQEILKDQKLSTNQAYIDLVNRVGHRIAKFTVLCTTCTSCTCKNVCIHLFGFLFFLTNGRNHFIFYLKAIL